MAFDPSTAVTVEDETPKFDPSSAVPVEAPISSEESGLHKFLFGREAAENVRGAIQDVVKGIPSMATQALQAGYEGLKFAAGSPQERAQIATQAVQQGLEQGGQIARDVESPLGSRENIRGLVNLGMMAAPAFGAVAETLRPTLHETLFGKKPPVQTLSEAAASEQVQKGVSEDASQVAGATSVPEPEVRPQVGEETPLRQQGETPQARQEIGQVEPVPQPEQPIEAGATKSGETGGVSAAAMEGRPIEAPPPGTGVGWQETRDYGNKWLDSGGDINKVMADFKRTGKLDEWEVGKGAAYLERLQSVTNRTADALRENPSDLNLQKNYESAVAAEQRFSNEFKPMATVASNQLKGFQGKVPLTPEMADSFTALTRKFGEIQGREVTPEEVVKADRIAKKNAKLKSDYQAANEELYNRADTEYGRIRTTRKGPPSLDDIGRTFGAALKEVCDV
jgi:hypothetical protein